MEEIWHLNWPGKNCVESPMKHVYQSAFELRVLLLNKHCSILFPLLLKVSEVKIISWPLLFYVVLLCISVVVLPPSCGLFPVYHLFSLKYSLQWSGLGTWLIYSVLYCSPFLFIVQLWQTVALCTSLGWYLWSFRTRSIPLQVPLTLRPATDICYCYVLPIEVTCDFSHGTVKTCSLVYIFSF